jgi:hypothetical protein
VRRTRNERISIQEISAPLLFDAKIGLQKISSYSIKHCFNKEIIAELIWHEA